ncbi:LysR substrate-binding domain-containing protein [Dyella silvae]|uniref:LysR substrate-binding domain-containing protein n=1 Tax=Dyella silvae TaxID=2994424 RepID=UPI002263BC6D|nr:LysR substrate-binding domain-containing protein [Dyella silvae]
MIAKYLQENPQVRVLVDATSRRVDLIEEGLDVAIRVRVPPLEDTELAVRPLSVSARILVASPALFQRDHVPDTIEALTEWPTLSMSSNGEKVVWNLLDAEGKTSTLTHQPRMATDDLASLRVAALQGLGVALLPRELIDADIKAGWLTHLLPHLSTTPGLIHAVFPSRRGMVPAVRKLLDALVEGFEKMHGQ